MRVIAGLLLVSLVLIGLVRAVMFWTYVFIRIQIPVDAHYLESAMVHFAWRAQHEVTLYPDWERYPHVANFYAPLSFVITGWIGRFLDTDIRGLYLIGRGVSVVSVMATTLVVGYVLRRRYGVLSALCGMLLSLGACPFYAAGVMTRPDTLAEFLGLTGFFLAEGRRRWTGIAAGLVLCLAAMTKQTALLYMAAAAVSLCLDGRGRRSLVLVGGVTATLLLTVAIVQWRIEPNFLRCLLGESQTPFRSQSWWNTVHDVATIDPEFFVLTAVGVSLWTTGRKRDPGLAVLALMMLSVTLVIAAKYGSAPNYFLSVNSVAALAGGALVSEMTQRNARPRPWHLLASVAVGAGLLLGVRAEAAYVYLSWVDATVVSPNSLGLLNQLRRVAANPDRNILTDSGTIDIYQGERTVFADPYRFKMMVEEGQIDPKWLRQKVAAQCYEMIVTTKELFSDDYLTFDRGLPAPIVEEARLRYSPRGEFVGLFLYERRPERSGRGP